MADYKTLLFSLSRSFYWPAAVKSNQSIDEESEKCDAMMKSAKMIFIVGRPLCVAQIRPGGEPDSKRMQVGLEFLPRPLVIIITHSPPDELSFRDQYRCGYRWLWLFSLEMQ
jgi:hypothetical protein